MTTRAKNEPMSKQAPHVAGIVVASLLALAAIVSAVVAPTDVAGRPAARAAMAAAN